MYKKLFLSLLVLAVIVGAGFFLVNKNRHTVEINNKDEPSEIPKDTMDYGTDHPPKYAPTDVKFGEDITLKIGEEFMVFDNSGHGIFLTLQEIRDSRCPQDVQCAWAGELSVVLDFSGNKLPLHNELILGTTNNKKVTSKGYTFSLKDATATSATITVVKN